MFCVFPFVDNFNEKHLRGMQFFTWNAFKSRFWPKQKKSLSIFSCSPLKCPLYFFFVVAVTSPGLPATIHQSSVPPFSIVLKIIQILLLKGSHRAKSHFEFWIARCSHWIFADKLRSRRLRCRFASTKIRFTKLTMNLHDKLRQNTFFYCECGVGSHFIRFRSPSFFSLHQIVS